MNELQAVHTFWLTLTVRCSASHKRIDVVHKMFQLRTLTNKHSVGNGDWFHSTRIIMNCKMISGQHMAPHHLSSFVFFNCDGSKSESDSLFARNPCSLNAASTSKDDLYLLPRSLNHKQYLGDMRLKVQPSDKLLSVVKLILDPSPLPLEEFKSSTSSSLCLFCAAIDRWIVHIHAVAAIISCSYYLLSVIIVITFLLSADGCQGRVWTCVTTISWRYTALAVLHRDLCSFSCRVQRPR